MICRSNLDTSSRHKLGDQPSEQFAQEYERDIVWLEDTARYPGLLLQPKSSPISQDQLAAEVEGIYGNLVMVEAKSMEIDGAQNADPNSSLGPEQWQALITLHRTLLYEHHDFFMATQHPWATPGLRGLAQKYSMLARMWRHGIHDFLEVLRHRRPQSQDYMLAFIYLAYQMLTLLFETVPAFRDIWVECLGDIARYTMAIEEDPTMRATWRRRAQYWYTMILTKHPEVGRLSHHLGILEPPCLRKLFLYSKALTSIVPLPNTQESLALLHEQVAQHEHNIFEENHSAEAPIATFYAYHFMHRNSDAAAKAMWDALSCIDAQTPAKLGEIGVALVLTNISFLFQVLERSSNTSEKDTSKNWQPQLSRPPAQGILSSGTTSMDSDHYIFCYSTFNCILKPHKDNQSLRHVLAAIHVSLVWPCSLCTVEPQASADSSTDICSLLLTGAGFDWRKLCELLNATIQYEPISDLMLKHGRQGHHPVSLTTERPRPLPEDFYMHGLVWTQDYFAKTGLDMQNADESTAIETAGGHKERVTRIYNLASELVRSLDFFNFDPKTKRFWIHDATYEKYENPLIQPPPPYDGPLLDPTTDGNNTQIKAHL